MKNALNVYLSFIFIVITLGILSEVQERYQIEDGTIGFYLLSIPFLVSLIIFCIMGYRAEKPMWDLIEKNRKSS